ncbi:hypothetical protein [Halomonas sp. M20]|uniref:hypothetical protein n=1 Tax=Halomonas sp. M20 TaxID=2763264 RepID=UPI001D0B0578|nr:hypothetical protein [Halomonas sp. M20]
MKKINKLALAVSAASAVMLSISQAQAFDRSDWDWELDVDTNIEQDIDIDVDLDDPNGLALVEVDQEFDGSLKAVSKVTDINNASEKNIHVTGSLFPTSLDIDVTYSGTGLGALGEIESTATAVANNASIETDVQTNLDSFQDWDGSGSIEAISHVAHINNMTVDSAATAVGNNLSLELKTKSGDDSILLANVVQDGRGYVSANSMVHDVDLHDVTPKGFEGPEISSAATAVGNNVSVKLNGVN